MELVNVWSDCNCEIPCVCKHLQHWFQDPSKVKKSINQSINQRNSALKLTLPTTKTKLAMHIRNGEYRLCMNMHKRQHVDKKTFWQEDNLIKYAILYSHHQVSIAVAVQFGVHQYTPKTQDWDDVINSRSHPLQQPEVIKGSLSPNGC